MVSRLSALALAVGLGVTPAVATAHGYMTYPRSRSIDHLAGDTPGWPIAGIKAKLRREPCVGLRFNNERTRVGRGPVTLRFLFPDGANHVGACTAFLFDPQDPANRVKIGEANDCARSDYPEAGQKGEDIPGHMQVFIPAAIPCDPAHCVLQWVWVAKHKGESEPERYEHYDNCADIEIVDVDDDVPFGESAPLPQQAPPSQPPAGSSAVTSVDVTSLAGYYSVDSVQGGWDEGEIRIVWTDSEGGMWGLDVDPHRPDRLTTDSTSPYLPQGRREFILERDDSGRIVRLRLGDATLGRDSPVSRTFRAESVNGKSYVGELKLVWENRAGVSWGLEPDPAHSDVLRTDERNPYYRQGIVVFELMRDAAGRVKAYRFGGAVYIRR